MKKIFVDKEIKVLQGEEAEKMLNIKNDSKYLKDNAIMSVSYDRWLEAQYYEKKTWMSDNRHISDDRNYHHHQKFDSYIELVNYKKTNKIDKIIELGCGPFTNLRTILNILEDVKEIHLLDPLLDEYLTHPNCFYKDKKISNKQVQTHSTPIEEFNVIEKYDMVLMNNVLEHCYDINKIFDKINEILNQNGLLIFSDVYYKNDEADKMVYEVYDSGHPLKLSENFLNNFLNNFNVLYNVDIHGLYNQPWRNDKYFIGTKK